MSLRVLPLCRLAVAVVAVASATRVHAQLATKSPFMAPQAAASNAPTAGAPLEFRALLETAEGVQFRLYDPAKKSGTWVRLNEKNAELDVLAKQHDDSLKPPTLTVEHQGRTLTLALREAKVVSSGAPSQIMPPPPPQSLPSNVAPAVTQAVVLNPTPADEQRRLEAVAAEVARRRALREQATQQVQGGSTATMQPQPVQPQQMQPQQNLPNAPRTALPNQPQRR